MSAIVRYKCDRCPFEQKGVESYVCVVTDDGEEKACPHPCEKMLATGVTGTSWRQLVSQGRIRVKCALLCLACGHLDYYAMTSGDRYIHNIYYRPSVEEAASISCSSCGERKLYPLCGPQDGCLTLLLFLFRIRKPAEPRLLCPLCKSGNIFPEGVAIT